MWCYGSKECTITSLFYDWFSFPFLLFFKACPSMVFQIGFRRLFLLYVLRSTLLLTSISILILIWVYLSFMVLVNKYVKPRVLLISRRQFQTPPFCTFIYLHRTCRPVSHSLIFEKKKCHSSSCHGSLDLNTTKESTDLSETNFKSTKASLCRSEWLL